MLSFFRKYQKVFFIFLAIIIIVSFTFFGVVTGPSVEEVKIEDKPLGKKVDGSTLFQRERDVLVAVLGNSLLGSSSDGGLPPLMNGGIVEKEWLGPGFAMMTARHDFSVLKPALEERIVSILAFKPYVHPKDPSLNVLRLYDKYAPQVSFLLKKLQALQDPLSLDGFLILMQLYLAEKQIPSDTLKQVISFEERQRGLEHDVALEVLPLGLFGFSSLEEWFGKKWIEKTAEYILQIAAQGRSQGYSVSSEEALGSLYRAVAENYAQVFRKQIAQGEEISRYLQLEKERLQISDRELMRAWEEIFLFQKVIKDVGLSAFVDPLMAKSFQDFSHQAKSVELIEVKDSLRLKNMHDLFLLETYLRGISGAYVEKKDRLSLPKADPIDQIVKRAPHLIERTYQIEYKKVSREEVLSLLSTKETWNWETQKENFAKLQEKFALGHASSEESRLEVLAKLSVQKRLEVDRYARQEMISADKEIVERLLEGKNLESLEISLRAAGGKIPLAGIVQSERFKNAIISAPVGKGFVSYAEEEGDFYKIQVISKKSPTLIAFERAKQEGILEEIFLSLVENPYNELKKKKSPLVYERSGKVLPLNYVKDEMGKILYGDLLEAIEKSYAAYFGKSFPKGENHASFRFLAPIQQVKEEMTNLPAEWQFSKNVVSLTRSSPYAFAKEKLFTSPENQWSQVEKEEGGNLALYRVLDSAEVAPHPKEMTLRAQELLAQDARRSFILDLLERMK